MKKLLALLLCLELAGCATMGGVRTSNRENLMKLSVGMTKQEALEIMGTKKITTYEPSALYLAPLTAQAINNPYRSEILQGKDKTFEVLYYYTDVKQQDRKSVV